MGNSFGAESETTGWVNKDKKVGPAFQEEAEERDGCIVHDTSQCHLLKQISIAGRP